jgi:hypothetical protein
MGRNIARGAPRTALGPLLLSAWLLAVGLWPGCGDEPGDDTDGADGASSGSPGSTDSPDQADTTSETGPAGPTDAPATTDSTDETDPTDLADPTDLGPDDTATPPTARRGYMITRLSFAQENPAGVSAGFDLDARVTPTGDRESCGRGDFTSPDGTGGVDNQLARLLPAISLVGGDVLVDLLQAVINDGTLIVLLTFDDGQSTAVGTIGPADPATAARLSVQMGTGQPLLGNDGEILFDQTFGINHQYRRMETTELAWDDAALRLTTGAFDLDMPVTVLSESFVLDVKQARVMFTMHDDRTLSGVMGGTVLKSKIASIAINAVGEGTASIVTGALDGTADMLYERGKGCAGISAALSFEAIPVYVVEWPATTTDQTGDTGGDTDGATDAETTGE